MRYNPALDGLRAVAIILVMLFHARTPGFSGGFLGVDVFFVLSGYLITTILLKEHDNCGSINIGQFYLKRFFRLTPALFTMLAVYLLVSPLLWSTGASPILQAGIAAAYLSDYAVAFWGIPKELSHTWSLSVEEHFYLIWPLFLLALCKRFSPRQILLILGCAYVLSVGWRWFWVEQNQTWNAIYNRFDTHASGLLLGAFLAAALRIPDVADWLEKKMLLLIWLPFTALLFLAGRWKDPWMLTYGIGFAEWGSLAALLFIQGRSGRAFRMLAVPVAVWIGRLSYSLYLWHYPVFRYLRAKLEWNEVLLIGIPISLALAALSYFTVEMWGLRLRDKFKQGTHPSPEAKNSTMLTKADTPPV